MGPLASHSLSEAEIARRLNERMQPEWAQTISQANNRDIDNALTELYSPLRPAAVLVPLLRIEEQWHLLFTRRAETLQNHKGQVAFPGGAAEPGDDSLEGTALRETFEEIGLPAEAVHLLGRLSSRPTISHFIVTPVVGHIQWPYTFHLSFHEVNRVFTIPLDWLADPANREERRRSLPNGMDVDVIYFQTYDGELLWGATARITLDLLHALHLIA